MAELPEGYDVRPARLDEAAALDVPFQESERKYYGHSLHALQEFTDGLQTPELTLEKDTRAVFAPDGACAGFVRVLCQNPWVRIVVSGSTHPAHEGKGIGTWLVEWAVARASQQAVKAQEGIRVTTVAHSAEHNDTAVTLLQAHGFVPTHTFYEMRIEMETAPLVTAIPSAFTVRTMDIERDTEALYVAVEDTFKDHYGHVQRPYAEGLTRWKRNILGYPTFDPSLVLIADATNPGTGTLEIAGFSVNAPESFDPQHGGWVLQLGVREQWRRRGLAKALLTKTFELFQERGAQTVGLGVDATGNAGALKLYDDCGMKEMSREIALELVVHDGKAPH